MVLLSILDHYVRRDPEDERVVGALLGSIGENGEAEVRTSFPVTLILRDDETVGMDFDYFKTVLDLHQRVNPKEGVIGWYATGTEIALEDCAMHEQYAMAVRQITKEPLNPFFLAVDTSLQNDRLGYRAYARCVPGASLPLCVRRVLTLTHF